MDAVFVEMSDFTKWITRFLPDDAYADLQDAMMDNPAIGAVMPGCGGLRKVRVANSSRGTGKRGGVRVIYMYVPEVHRFYMIDAYSKSEKSDFTSSQKKQLAQLASWLRKQATSHLKAE